jgi:hypothetical protein
LRFLRPLLAGERRHPTPTAALPPWRDRPFARSNAQSFDHLDCYKISRAGNGVVTSPHAADPLALTPFQIPPLSTEDGCLLRGGARALPKQFCVPVDKTPRQAPVGQNLGNDFLCYEAKCPSLPDIASQGVADQFVHGTFKVSRKSTSRMICVPALKTTAVPPCGLDGAGACGGTCTAGIGRICQVRCDPAANTNVCGCGLPTVSCSASSAPSCGGSCPVTTQACRPVVGAATCACQ